MSLYLHSNDFKKKYPQKKSIGRGSYGEVYHSNDETVVKIQKVDLERSSPALHEIDIYHRFEHPGIIPLLNYSIE